MPRCSRASKIPAGELPWSSMLRWPIRQSWRRSVDLCRGNRGRRRCRRPDRTLRGDRRVAGSGSGVQWMARIHGRFATAKRSAVATHAPAGVGYTNTRAVSEQPHGPQLARGSRVVVGLGVGLSHFMHQRQSRAEVPPGQPPIVQEHPDAAGAILTGPARYHEWRPIALVVSSALLDAGAQVEAMWQRDLRTRPQPSALVTPTLGVRALAPPLSMTTGLLIFALECVR